MFDQAERLRQLALGANDRRKIIKQKKIPRVITVTSGKGGVGKTNLVVNLAIALSRLGKRVAVLDADLGLANVDIILGLLPLHNLQDVVKGTKMMEDIIITGPEGIKIIPGGSGLAEMANLSPAQRDRLLQSLMDLENAADILLIDTGAGLSRSVLSFVSAADELVVITTPEPTSITDAYGIIKVVSKLRVHQKIKLVVNQVRDHEEGTVIAERFAEVSQKFLQVDVEFLGEICSDGQVVRAVKQQQPLVTLFPRARATKDVENIAGKLLDIMPGKPRGISGFLSRFTKMMEK
ncbi:MinD/ParA family protein [Dethiobacter alkaliphilus]|uniref:MinD/ParA family protein n=1 Tax=Dethiobacter alkaliphilus TaxID=427926 RepID=UPI002225B7AA|nr:MinD/ParA family protein [Dethiobacter alkaliphilus]MCW3488728.1 MinD/ParA family protein [Dethiobacter alkaliphilus]